MRRTLEVGGRGINGLQMYMTMSIFRILMPKLRGSYVWVVRANTFLKRALG
jgi:hypothetical protein